MRILSIETSCDDTCMAIIETFDKGKPRFKVLSNIVSSQVEIHKKWGGVFPSLAKREHQRNLPFVLIKALKDSKLLMISKPGFLISEQRQNSKLLHIRNILQREEPLFKNLKKLLIKYEKPDIDAVALTVGPGLEPCLWVGVNFARALSCYWELPIIPANHIEAHILVNWLETNKKIRFPAICLVASGGHTQLILMKKVASYKILGETRDDAAGECFDKTARILSLGYPGGPTTAAIAARFKIQDLRFKIKLPRPMLNQKNYDFSFSGLKTAVLYDFKNRPLKIKKSRLYIQEMCFEIQQAIVDVLLNKTKNAAKDYQVKTVILGGGVTANKELRKQFTKFFLRGGPKLIFPKPNFSTDNAVMIGITAFFHFSEKKNLRFSTGQGWKQIIANANLSIIDNEF